MVEAVVVILADVFKDRVLRGGDRSPTWACYGLVSDKVPAVVSVMYVRSSGRAGCDGMNVGEPETLHPNAIKIGCLDLRGEIAHIAEAKIVSDDDQEIWAFWRRHY